MKKIAVLTGAGVSAESGIKTFRDAGGLWEGHDIMEVASPEGWQKNPALVLDFYNRRRRQLREVLPNAAHTALAELEARYRVTVITQNVDDLHERAGSTRVIHLHGELLKARSTVDERLVYEWTGNIRIGDLCERNSQLRPHIVWFGEMVPLLEEAAQVVTEADALLVVGTSMQVYPAAGLVRYAGRRTPVYFIDPKPAVAKTELANLEIIAEKATVGVPLAIRLLAGKLP